MDIYQVKTPVAFFIFNRPETTRIVFSEIARVRPRKILIVSDGSRLDRLGEAEKVSISRDIIKQINWECEVLTNFSDINLGCKKRISTGIDWVFNHVPEAIILEDDCLPDTCFFRFCDEMLERYRLNKSVGMISGINFQNMPPANDDSYYFSKYSHIWGWASWRDRWLGTYDVNILDWPEIKSSESFKSLMTSANEFRYWVQIFDRVYRGDIDTWDYQWMLANWVFGRVNIIPAQNLISNIGFGQDATHTKGFSPLSKLKINKLIFPLSHPTKVIRDAVADSYTEKNYFSSTLSRKIYRKMHSLFGRFF